MTKTQRHFAIRDLVQDNQPIHPKDVRDRLEAMGFKFTRRTWQRDQTEFILKGRIVMDGNKWRWNANA